MLNKTHLAIGIFFMLFFLSRIVHVWAYVIVFVIATLLPNLDRFIYFNGLKIVGAVRSRKRGFFHSFTFCFIVTFLLAWFFPIVAFPFFLGYGVHLLADSWTIDGIKPFWPLRYVSKGNVRDGGSFEYILFYSFVVADFVMLWFLF